MEIAFGFPLLFSNRDFGFKFSDMAKCQFFKKRQRNAIKDHYATFLSDWRNRRKYILKIVTKILKVRGGVCDVKVNVNVGLWVEHLEKG